MSKPFFVDDGDHHRQHIPRGHHECLDGVSKGQLDCDIVFTNLCGYNEPLNVLTECSLFPGLLIILAKLSDIFGGKPLILFAVFIFTVFSVACGVSRRLLDLYVRPSICCSGYCG